MPVKHICDDLAALDTIKKIINMNGEQLISVPAYKFMWGRQDGVSDHKRWHTKNIPTDAFSEAGFSVKCVIY